MVESLLIELKDTGLDLNATKTNISTTDECDMSSASFVGIDREIIDVFQSDEAHQHLGRMLNLNADNRVQLNISLRKRCAWLTFHKHK